MVSKSTLALLATVAVLVAVLGVGSPTFAQDAYNIPQQEPQTRQAIVHRDRLYDSIANPNVWSFDAEGSAAARGNSH
jgi:hypothetical protein